MCCYLFCVMMTRQAGSCFSQPGQTHSQPTPGLSVTSIITRRTATSTNRNIAAKNLSKYTRTGLHPSDGGTDGAGGVLRHPPLLTYDSAAAAAVAGRLVVLGVR